MPKIDNMVIFRCVQVVRRLLLKNREIGVFCNLSGATLTDATVFQQVLEFMDANRAIAPSVVLELTQERPARGRPDRERKPLGARRPRLPLLARQRDRTCASSRASLRRAASASSRCRRALLLDRNVATTDIHPADLSDLLGRFGIDLIAEKIESEGMVVDLLDYDVRFGQGFLFSPPRPVRAEALQGVAERGDVIARDADTGEQALRLSAGARRIRATRERGLAQLARNAGGRA